MTYEFTQPEFLGTVSIKKLSENATIPTRGSDGAAGFDLYAAEDAIIPTGSAVKVSTDIALAIPRGMFAGIYARSGLATKNGIRPANCVGVIDSDYRGPVIVALHNDTQFNDFVVHKGDRIAQIIFQPVINVDFAECEELPKTDRGDGGFGSTGTN